MTASSITLRLAGDGSGWLATFAGEHRAEIVRLFGTDTIQYGYTARAGAFYVRDQIASLNRGVPVKVAGLAGESLTHPDRRAATR